MLKKRCFPTLNNFSSNAIAVCCFRFTLAIHCKMLLILAEFALENQKLPRRFEMLNATLLVFLNLDDDMT
ncbi:hypothetical protein PN465_21020 [Nodularia spumigena CS-584]|uniref:Uncharacterized protein n=1 Tax=Nodularia spumigena UHCC 0060 TaxID=3110300 RepID=A0ABU5UMM1_NODSP|nr:hypothetical protein [Nodularia spumigena]MDB9384676.1 hypothetical protein [Nodularia spumigena CS-584]MEA5607513.1 hypothetical protein [Nodularia spumigena UHCC 0060]